MELMMEERDDWVDIGKNDGLMTGLMGIVLKQMKELEQIVELMMGLNIFRSYIILDRNKTKIYILGGRNKLDIRSHSLSSEKKNIMEILNIMI